MNNERLLGEAVGILKVLQAGVSQYNVATVITDFLNKVENPNSYPPLAEGSLPTVQVSEEKAPWESIK